MKIISLWQSMIQYGCSCDTLMAWPIIILDGARRKHKHKHYTLLVYDLVYSCDKTSHRLLFLF